MHNSNLNPIFKDSEIRLSKCRVVLLLICLIGIASNRSWAQNTTDKRLSSLISKVDSLVKNHISTVPINDSRESVKDLDDLFQIDTAPSRSYEVQVIDAEQKKLYRDLGLDLNAGYLENLEQGVFNVEGIFYRRRVQVELEWDILNNGYVDNRQEVKELENEKKVAGFKHKRLMESEEFDTLQFALQNYFNRQKYSITQSYLKILEDRHQVAAELHELNYKPWEEVIEVTSQKARAQVELENYRAFNRQFASTAVGLSADGKLPLVNIRLDKLLEGGQFKSLQDSITSEQIKKIGNEYSVWRDISLSTFVRYNYFNNSSDVNLSNLRNREYFSVGLNLSVPLPLLKTNNENIAQAREDLLNSELTRNKNKVRNELYSDYSRYQQRLQQYIQSYKTYLQLQTRIKKQQQREELEDPEYSPIQVLELLTERFKVAKELLDIKQAMYEIILDLHEQVPSKNFSQFLYRINTSDFLATTDTLNRKVYMWSSTFAEQTNQELIKYLHEQRIQRVLLSIGPDTSLMEKASSFIEEARFNNISVEIMVGDNTLLQPGHDQEVMNIFKRTASLKAEGVHLDVEPHTNSDWDSREKEYKELYSKLIKRASDYSDEYGLSLSISIPVFYDSIISELVHYADEIYVMAYGTDNIESINNRIQKELEATHRNITIALRPEDFDNKQMFEAFMEKLARKTKVDAMAIHDLEALMNLYNTQVTVNDYEE